jgi:hypothetical protein
MTNKYLIIESSSGRTITGANTPATAQALVDYWQRKNRTAYHARPIGLTNP